MKKLGLLVATIAMAGMATSAQADTKVQAKARPVTKPVVKNYDPLLKCDSLEFRIRGGGIQPIIGIFEIKGEGKVSRTTGKQYVGRFHCTDLDSNKPVDVLATVIMGSDRGIAPRVAVGYFELEGKTDLNFRGKAKDLADRYVVADGKIAWGVGLGIQTMIIDNHEARLQLRLKPVFGAGVSLGFSTVKIIPMSFAKPMQLTDID